jgi:thiosulfate/3-mercaptopyruvate sulfurtransferase
MRGAAPLALLDARSPSEFDGSELYGNPRGGSIPGAVNVPFATLFDPQTGLLLPPARLQAIFAAAGLHDRTAPVATYCQLGIRASVAAVALREAGYEHAGVYEGGAKEWLADPALPVND